MRHHCPKSATFLLLLVVQSAGAYATAKVLFSDDVEQHAVGVPLGTLRPVVRGSCTDTGNTTIVATDTPLAGFSPSEPLTGDDLRHSVRFAGQTDISATASKAVVLRFTLKNADLYSVAFRGEPRSSALQKTPDKLRAGQAVKIVCLGDSVTGIYYHTGGRCAYPEMLKLALQLTHPDSEVTVVNAGISGNKTSDGLNRLQTDVLDHRPDLVTVMFGLNDLTALPLADFRANLAEILRRCRAVGAEVMLCTPNSVITTPARPVSRLVEYCDAIKQVAAEQQAPVCDLYAAYEAIHARDPLAWRLLLSDEIHPNMDGHKLNAETLARAITGREVSLNEIGPPQPTLPRTLSLVQAGKPVRVLAMEPLDKLLYAALKALLPATEVQMQSWPTSGQSLAEIEAAAQAVRQTPPDLVVIAVPAAVTPPVESASEEAIRAYSWILNWSLSFGRQEWDVVAVAPSMFTLDPTPQQQAADRFARQMIRAQHLNLVARQPSDRSPPERVLQDWLGAQLLNQ